jgi:hypothetical protein
MQDKSRLDLRIRPHGNIFSAQPGKPHTLEAIDTAVWEWAVTKDMTRIRKSFEK